MINGFRVNVAADLNYIHDVIVAIPTLINQG